MLKSHAMARILILPILLIPSVIRCFSIKLANVFSKNNIVQNREDGIDGLMSINRLRRGESYEKYHL